MNTTEKIEKILDGEIRPYLNSHDGDITIESFNEGILVVRMWGACATCMAVNDTFDELIKERLKDIPEIKDIQLYTGVSDELLDMARKILNKEIKLGEE